MRVCHAPSMQDSRSCTQSCQRILARTSSRGRCLRRQRCAHKERTRWQTQQDYSNEASWHVAGHRPTCSGGEAVPALCQDLHHVVCKVSPCQVQPGDGVWQRIPAGHSLVLSASCSLKAGGWQAEVCHAEGRRCCSCAALESSKMQLRAAWCTVQSIAGGAAAVQLLYQNCEWELHPGSQTRDRAGSHPS